MPITVHTNQLALRVGGTVTGLGFLCLGLYSLLGSDGLSPAVAERAEGFALAAIVAGIWAVAVSWLDPNLRGVWCRAPSRLRRRRDVRKRDL